MSSKSNKKFFKDKVRKFLYDYEFVCECIKLDFLEQVFCYMTYKRISKRKLAKKLGVSIKTLNEYFDGDIDLMTIAKIVTKLGCSVSISLIDNNKKGRQK